MHERKHKTIHPAAAKPTMDIVERLRADKTRYVDEMSINAQNLRHEAADEIERLRKALRGLAMYAAGRLPTKEDLDSDAMKNAATALNPEATE